MFTHSEIINHMARLAFTLERRAGPITKRFSLPRVLAAGIISWIVVTGCGLANLGQSAALPPQTRPAELTGAATPSATLPAAATLTRPTGLTPPAPSAATRLPTAPAAAQATVTAQKTLPPLRLSVASPADETIVSVPSIAVVGQTTPGAVVSVDGDLVDVDAAGKFQKTIQLDEGPNVIEIVASDLNGSEANVILSVIYEP